MSMYPAQATRLVESMQESARRKLERFDWARTIASDLQHASESFSRAKLQLPVGPGDHDQEYHCPDCGTFLQLDPVRPHEHRCIFCGKTFQGATYDSVWKNRIHTMVSLEARTAAYTYMLSPSPDLFNALRDLLIFYSERYKGDFPEQGPEYSRGKVTNTGLTEAMWSLNLLWVYITIARDLGREDCEKLREGLFLPVACLLAPQATIIHNIHTSYMSAVGAIAAVFQDDALLESALDGPSGLYAQISNGFYSDGLWYEGAPTYHFFTLSMMLQLITFAGVDVKVSIPRFADFFLAPWQIVQPNLVLPALNDCYFGMEPSRWHVISDRDGGWHLSRFAPYYEMASALTCEEELSRILSALYLGDLRNRTSPEALFFGPDELPPPVQLPDESLQMEATGYGILRGNDVRRNRVYALLKYGQHGRNHEHFDKMQVIIYGNDETVVPDLGAIVYAHPLHRAYYKGSLGHNLVVVNGRDQQRAIGHSCYFVPAPFLQLVEAEEDDMTHDAITQNRVLILSDSYIIDLYQIRCPFENTYDWIHHNVGVLLAPGLFSEQFSFGDERYDSVFRNRRLFVADQQWEARFRTSNGSFRLLMEPDRLPTLVVAAEGPANPASRFIPVLIARRKTSSTTFIVLYEFYDEQPAIKAFSSTRLPLDQGWEFSVSAEKFTDTILFSRTSGKNRKESRRLNVKGKLGALREFKDGQRLVEIVDGTSIQSSTSDRVKFEQSKAFHIEFLRPTDAVVKLRLDGERETVYFRER
jgi:hypothetical protein